MNDVLDRTKPTIDVFVLVELAKEVSSGFAAGYIRKKARGISRRSAGWLADADDIEQQLMLQLLERLPDFDETRGCFNAFVKMVVDGDAANLQRELVRRGEERRGECSLSTLVEGSEGLLEPLANSIGDREGDARRGLESRSSTERVDLVNDMEFILSRFSRAEQKIFRQLMEGSPTRVAGDVRRSRSTIYALIRRAKRRLVEAGFEAPRGRIRSALCCSRGDYPNRHTSHRTRKGERCEVPGKRSYAECADRC